MLADRMGLWDEEWFQDRYTRLRLDLEDHKSLYSEFVARTLIDHDDIAWILPELIAGVGRAARGGRS